MHHWNPEYMEVLMWVVFKVFYLLYDLPSMAIGSRHSLPG
jgi:hypothetical protein